MKKFLSLLLLSLLCVIAVARTSSLIFTKECGGSGTADDGVKWNVKSDGVENTFDDKSGIRFGSNKDVTRYLELSTSDIPGTITSVVVNARDAQECATVTVTVGGEDFVCSGSTTATNESADYSFSGSGKGTILVRIDRNEPKNNSIYVKSVIVTYRADDEPFITLNPDFGVYDEPQTVFVSVENMPKNAVIVYNFVANAPKADVEWQNYDEAKGIFLDKSGLLTVAVQDEHGEELTSIEGDYTINSTVTGIEAISGKAVAGVRYYNVAGVSSDKAFDGINIVVTTFTDGTKTVTKAVK